MKHHRSSVKGHDFSRAADGAESLRALAPERCFTWLSSHLPQGLLRFVLPLVIVAAAATAQAQKLSPKWEELTASDFVRAVHQSQGVCVLPFGILEKHGPHLPIGTDLPACATRS